MNFSLIYALSASFLIHRLSLFLLLLIIISGYIGIRITVTNKTIFEKLSMRNEMERVVAQAQLKLNVRRFAT